MRIPNDECLKRQIRGWAPIRIELVPPARPVESEILASLVHSIRQAHVDLVDRQEKFAPVFQIDGQKLTVRFDLMSAAF